VSLIKGQNWPSAVPSQTTYAAFCGGWGILIALIGVVALFVEALQGLIIGALDGLTTLLVLAGAIVSPNPVHYIHIRKHLCREEKSANI
jgi:hypothetical protein